MYGYAIVKCWRGYYISARQRGTKFPAYLYKVGKDGYKWACDYSFARIIKTEETARKHLLRLSGKDGKK